MTVTVHHGDSRDVLKTLADASIDSVVTDPPYALASTTKRWANTERTEATMPKVPVYARSTAGFMGQKWDTGETAFDPAFWFEVLRVLKPGGHLIAFGGTRTYHRLAVAIEDAGFEIRDQIGWLYGSGFPKSHDVSKAIDKAAGATREIVGKRTGRAASPRTDMRGGRLVGSPDRHLDLSAITAPATDDAKAWEGWGTALKPAWEPIVLGRKPLIGTVAANVLTHGTGAINVDGCRVPSDDDLRAGAGILPMRHHPEIPRGRVGEPSHNQRYTERGGTNFAALPGPRGGDVKGRFPANIIHDGSDEVIAAFPEQSGGGTPAKRSSDKFRNTFGEFRGNETEDGIGGSSGNAARFFYSAKADKGDRLGSKHPTVKPVDLMAYLCRLITPPGGTVLDPFAGSGSTGMACLREGFDAVLIEREEKFVADIKRRIAHVSGEDAPLFAHEAAQ